VTAAHDRRLVAAAQAAVTAGMDAAQQYHEAAGRAPGQGALVALPVPASGAATGEGYGVPAGVPAIRPVVRPSPVPSYADLTVGGIGPGGYHGNTSGASGALEGVPVPSVRSDSLVYIPVSSPATPKPSLGSRLRSALRTLWSRS
jgi:hypothetical protein